MGIDPTARVADGARVGNGVEIGPFCVVGPNVELGDGVRLLAHVHVTGVTTVGEGSTVYPFASLGTPPQSVHYRGGATRLVIGPRCDIREGVTMNTGTEDAGGVTRVGERGLFMVGCHIGHDCQIGDHATFANNVVLGGHVSVGNNTFIGGLTAIHQFNRVGEGAMIGGMTRVRADVIPFGHAYLDNLVGLNVIGLRRRGAKRAELQLLWQAYRKLFFDEGVFAERIDAVADQFAGDPLVEKIIAFIRVGGKRALMHPSAGRQPNDNGDDAS